MRVVHWWATHDVFYTGRWALINDVVTCSTHLLLIGVATAAVVTRHRGLACRVGLALLITGLVSGDIASIVSSTANPWHYLPASVAEVTASGLLLLASIVLISPLAPRAARPPRDRWVSPQVFFFTSLAMAAGAMFKSAFQWLPFTTKDYPMPDHPSQAYMAYEVVRFVLAGPTEEVFFCLLVVGLLRQAGSRWTTVACWCVGLRLLFHLYYGPPALFLMVWPLLILALYRSTGRWIAIAAMHSVNDVAAGLNLGRPLGLMWFVIGMVLLVGRWTPRGSRPAVSPFWVGPVPLSRSPRTTASTGDSPSTL